MNVSISVVVNDLHTSGSGVRSAIVIEALASLTSSLSRGGPRSPLRDARPCGSVASIDATLGIAIWGAVTGTVATLGGVVALVRDRPKLVARQHVEVKPGPTEAETRAQLVLLIVNEGRQPVTVRSAGFGVDPSRSRLPPFRRRGPFAVFAGTRDQATLPMRLEAGTPLELRLDVKAVGKVNPRKLPRGFAEDSRGKVGEANPRFTAESLEDAQEVGSRTFTPRRDPLDPEDSLSRRGLRLLARIRSRPWRG